MSTKTSVAKAMRNLGLGRIVDSRRIRDRFGAPTYNHLVKKDTGPKAFDDHPLLTVVVPAYNVSDYLASCLDSVLAQTYTNLDVLVIDDGSTDDTPRVADAYAREHKRVRVIHQPNAGLGAARNKGLDNSTSQFITFVDSDDLVPSQAYERAMSSLHSTGSDVCIGSVSRFDRRNKWLPFWVRLAHDEDRLSITGSEFPPIMWDVFAWNKVYRRSTWDRLVGRFPEGTLYEDQECTAELFTGDAKLDVLKDVGYNWRLRDDNSSITQQKTSIDDLTQRLDVIFKVRHIIEASNPSYISYWYTKTLGEDLFFYIREVPRASDEFFELLSTKTAQLWDNAPASSLEGIDPIRRLLAYYTAYQGRDELTRLLVHLERTKNTYRGSVDVGQLRFTIEDPDGDEFEIPESLQLVVPESLNPRVEIDSYVPKSNGDVTFTGYAFIPNFDVSYGYSADLFDPESGTIAATLEVTNDSGPLPSRLSDHYHDYADRRFRLTIPRFVVDDLAGRLSSTQSSSLQLRLHIHLGDFSWTEAAIKRDLHSPAGYPSASPMTDRGARVAIQGDPRQKTEVVVLQPSVVADAIDILEDELRVRIKPVNFKPSTFATGPSADLYLAVSEGNTELARAPFEVEGELLTAALALPRNHYSASACVLRLDLHITSGSGMRWALAIDRNQASRRRDRDFVVGISGFGYAVLDRPLQAATADTIEIMPDGQSLKVTGSYALEPAVARTVTPTFALVGARGIIHPNSVSVDQAKRTFEVQFPLSVSEREATRSSLAPDRYILQLLLATGKSHPASAWVAGSYELQERFPQQTLTPLHLITMNSVGTSRSVRIDLTDRLDPETELGRRNQALSSAVFISPKNRLDSATVLFESFSGNAIADSPLALDREIALDFPNVSRVWTVKSPQTPVPEGAQAVVFGSRAWFDAASTARVLINNNNFPHYFRKRPGQFYVQTWHGTPLKRIGNHVPARNLSLSYRELMKRESQSYWDLLLAQSAWAGDTLREAFDYNGSVLASGYPRNDVLADLTSSGAIRRATRRRLGINPEQRVVLYAPTWRDNLKEASGHYSSVDFLNVNSASKRLGRSFTILYRGHANSLNAGPQNFGNSIIDASTYPDINDLIAASDVLITDYSSIMFDYVVTGRPVIFLCPDLESYRDSVRGFYFDFEATAPGPIVKTASDAVDLLLTDQAFSVDSTERYVNFVERFSALDDGGASRRVISEIGNILS